MIFNSIQEKELQLKPKQLAHYGVHLNPPKRKFTKHKQPTNVHVLLGTHNVLRMQDYGPKRLSMMERKEGRN